MWFLLNKPLRFWDAGQSNFVWVGHPTLWVWGGLLSMMHPSRNYCEGWACHDGQPMVMDHFKKNPQPNAMQLTIVRQIKPWPCKMGEATMQTAYSEFYHINCHMATWRHGRFSCFITISSLKWCRVRVVWLAQMISASSGQKRDNSTSPAPLLRCCCRHIAPKYLTTTINHDILCPGNVWNTFGVCVCVCVCVCDTDGCPWSCY